MRIIAFITALTDKLTPMSSSDKIDLVNEASADYNNQLKDVNQLKSIKEKTKQGIELSDGEKTFKPDVKTKAFYYLEMWQVRFVLAILFPVVLKFLTDYLYSKPDEKEFDDYDD